MPVLVNLGSGDVRAPAPWVNVDHLTYRSLVKPDVVSDVRELPFRDGCTDRVYASHLLEHIPLGPPIMAVLRETYRILKPGAKACFVGPDIDRALIVAPDNEYLHYGIRYGEGRWLGDRHQWVATGPKTLEVVREVFSDADEIPIDTIGADWPCTHLGTWQFCIIAWKET